jgi:CxxC motif-containing protein (DUF1111 family)
MLRAIVFALAVGAACTSDLAPEPGEELSAGPLTVFEAGPNAFGHPVPGLDIELERAFFRGRALFRDDWVAAPASTETRDGLGPLFNARSCEACHIADGRGRPPRDGERALGPMLVRLGVRGPDGIAVPEPTYGGQFQPFAILGVVAEGTVTVTYEELPGTYGDGTAYTLRRPHYAFSDLGYGLLDPSVMVSPRIPPAMIGMGLLAAIAADAIAAREDSDDADGDGISGRRRVAGAELGRFGLKAGQASVAHQVTAAFNGDLGLTSSAIPNDDCTAVQSACRAAISGGAPELITAIEHHVTRYSELLAVPARRRWDAPEVLRGKTRFEEAGCASCHVPSHVTGASELALLQGIQIRPYTDLLLHDMGPALADDFPERGADGREWRTPPLWGIGLTQTVSGHELFLHDGRARGLAEAILWHGGEAERARDMFRNYPEADRDDLLAFLQSL